MPSPFLRAPPVHLEDVDWKNWQATDPATLMFVVRAGKILLIHKKRGLGAGKINGPGGKLETGESPLQCALRETREEIGIEVENPEYAGRHLFQFVDGYSLRVDVFRASRFRGEPVETDEARPVWFPLEAIPYDEMWEDDRLWLPALLVKKIFRGRWLFEADRMLDYELEFPGAT